MEKYANKLPIELINKIINYTDVVAFRTGKYIDRIPKTDARYTMLRNMKRPIKDGKNKLILKLLRYDNCETYGYIIEYIFNNNCVKSNISYVNRFCDYDCYEVGFKVKSKLRLIYDANGYWHKRVNYIM